MLTLCCACWLWPAGLAWGVHLAEPGVVTDDMIMAASETLPKLIRDEDLAAGKVYPRLEEIRCKCCSWPSCSRKLTGDHCTSQPACGNCG